MVNTSEKLPALRRKINSNKYYIYFSTFGLLENNYYKNGFDFVVLHCTVLYWISNYWASNRIKEGLDNYISMALTTIKIS